ncbi:hypothetical protein V6N13_054677 [Hibiscus sabdariffa]
MFAKEPIGWELMFGRVCWYIWCFRYDICFQVDDDSPQCSSLEQARSWLDTVVAAASSTAQLRQSLAATRHGRVQWSSPPLG